MNARNVIVSWREVGKDEKCWIRIEPGKVKEGIEAIKEKMRLNCLRKDNEGNVMTISNTKGEIITKLKEEDICK